MHKWCVGVFAMAAAGLTLAGCSQSGSQPVEPMPTDGPNQVVIRVPGMT